MHTTSTHSCTVCFIALCRSNIKSICCHHYQQIFIGHGSLTIAPGWWFNEKIDQSFRWFVHFIGVTMILIWHTHSEVCRTITGCPFSAQWTEQSCMWDASTSLWSIKFPYSRQDLFLNQNVCNIHNIGPAVWPKYSCTCLYSHCFLFNRQIPSVMLLSNCIWMH